MGGGGVEGRPRTQKRQQEQKDKVLLFFIRFLWPTIKYVKYEKPKNLFVVISDATEKASKRLSLGSQWQH